jgi:hypothetical protein
MMFFLQKWQHILLREGDVKYIDNKIKTIKCIEGPTSERLNLSVSSSFVSSE